MRKIGIVTDSTAYLPATTIKLLGIKVVPLIVQWNGKSYFEADPNATDVIDALRKGELATTSRPNPATFLLAYQELAANGAKEIISLHISSSMSGTSDAARIAAKDSPIPVHVIDSRTVGMALGFGVIAAAQAAEEGLDSQTIIQRAQLRMKATSIFFSVANLENLRRSGRISRGASLLATALAIRPILTVDDGEVVAVERVRTAAKAMVRLEEMAVAATAGRAVDVAVHHLGAQSQAEAVVARLRSVLTGLGEVSNTEVGAVVGTHVGPGAIAVVIAPRV